MWGTKTLRDILVISQRILSLLHWLSVLKTLMMTMMMKKKKNQMLAFQVVPRSQGVQVRGSDLSIFIHLVRELVQFLNPSYIFQGQVELLMIWSIAYPDKFMILTSLISFFFFFLNIKVSLAFERVSLKIEYIYIYISKEQCWISLFNVWFAQLDLICLCIVCYQVPYKIYAYLL